MQMMKKKLMLIILSILVILFVGLIIWLSGATYDRDDYYYMNEGWHIEINDAVYEDVNLGDFLFPALGKGDVLKMSCRLEAEDMVENPVFLLYTVHSDVQVFYQNQLIYSYGQRFLEENKLVGYGYHFVYFPEIYDSAELQVVMHISENDAFSSIKAPQLCNSETLFRDYINKNRMPLAINMFLIVFGILLIFVSVLFCFYSRRFFRLICVGCFSLGIGCWSLCNYDLITVFTDNLRTKVIVEFATIYVSPLFVLLYFWKDKFVTRNRLVETIYKILLTAQVCFVVVAFGLQITNVVHFPAVLKIQHLILLLFCIGIIALTIRDISKKQLENKILVIGITLLLAIGLSDLVRFSLYKYLIATDEASFTSYLCVGALIFVLSQLIEFGAEITAFLLNGAKAQALEEMAYIDGLTGIANRRRCEEMWDSLDKKPTNYGMFSFDLNSLKQINDTKGHAMGDMLIKTFATILAEVFGEYGVVGRVGGDEFAVIIPDMSCVDMGELKRQLEERIEQANHENPELFLSAACGFCSREQCPESDSRKIYRKADAYMYENKVFMKESAALRRERD